MNNKCKNFETCAENSDAECFLNNYLRSEEVVFNSPHICDICVYNEKHKHHTYDSWNEYRKKIGIEPKR